MSGVRRILTQLLMEVTEEEIKKTAETVIKKHRRKGILNPNLIVSSLFIIKYLMHMQCLTFHLPFCSGQFTTFIFFAIFNVGLK